MRTHPFFKFIDWQKLINLEIQPPFKPKVNSNSDWQNFDDEFTHDKVALSPVDKNFIQHIDQRIFHGFSYNNLSFVSV